MKWLYCISQSNNLQDIVWGFIENGITVEQLDRNVLIQAEGEALYREAEAVEEVLRRGCYDAAFGWNFCPSISIACEKCGIPYISWIFDAPELYAYAPSMTNSCNYIFVFDRVFCTDLKAKGANAYHLPLAANMTRLNSLVITDEEIARYQGEIGFVGSLYDHNKYGLFAEKLPPEFNTVMERIFTLLCRSWKEDALYHSIPMDALNLMRQVLPTNWETNYPAISIQDLYIGLILSRKMAAVERRIVLRELAEDFEVILYNSKDDLSDMGKVICRPGTSYEQETPKVYFSSRINLNLTLRSIRSGVPLRIFDITGVGGFVLSNSQPEFPELFIPDREVVLFSDMEELKDKARYYLQHESERTEIAMAGYRRTMKEHTMKQRARTIIDTVFPGRGSGD